MTVMGEAKSWAGPLLFMLGAAGLLLGSVLHGVFRKPAIFSRKDGADDAPSGWERSSVHLLVVGAWSAGFGLIVWRGPSPDGMDVRLPGEAHWPVWPWMEWVYAAGYLTPVLISWLAPTRRALRRLAFDLAALSLVSAVVFLMVPVVSPPRVSCDASLGGRLLAWETGRADFAAASLPSFHVFWAMLLASMLSARGRPGAIIGWSWATVMSAACVANGAHAAADVLASWVIWGALAFARARMKPDSGFG